MVEQLQQQGGGADELLNSIGRLKEEQAALRVEKKKVAKALKNAEKRRSRLKKKARQLSDTDLVAVLQMRAASAVERRQRRRPSEEGAEARRQRADGLEAGASRVRPPPATLEHSTAG